MDYASTFVYVGSRPVGINSQPAAWGAWGAVAIRQGPTILNNLTKALALLLLHWVFNFIIEKTRPRACMAPAVLSLLPITKDFYRNMARSGRQA